MQTQFTFAQVASNYSQFMFNVPAFNPAYAGSNPNLELTALYRNQWTKLSGRTISTPGLNIVAPIERIHSGVSATFVYDILGAQRNLWFNVGYASQLQVKKVKIGFGVNGGLVQATLLGNLLRAPEGNYADGVFNHNDPIIPLSASSGIAPSFGAGLAVTWKGLQIGFSASSIIEGKAKVSSPAGLSNVFFRRNLFGFATYKMPLSPKMSLQPSVLFKSDLKLNQFDINILWYFKDRFWAGAGFRGYNKKSSESVILLLGLNVIRNLGLGYSYDISVGGLRSNNFGSHEIMLTWRQPLKSKVSIPKTVYNPRFL